MNLPVEKKISQLSILTTNSENFKSSKL